MKNGEVTERKSLLDYMLEIAEANPSFTDDDIVSECCTFMLAVSGQFFGCSPLNLTFTNSRAKTRWEHRSLSVLSSLLSIKTIKRSAWRNFTTFSAMTIERRREMIWSKWSILRCALKKPLGEFTFCDQCRSVVELVPCTCFSLYPAVPLMSRRLGEDVKCGKTTLPAGSSIFVISYATHRLKHIYPDPEEFIPERFSPKNVEGRNAYAYLPFSAGPRNCIGLKFAMLEMKTVLSTLLRGYKLLPVEGKTKLEPVFRVTLRSRGGIWVEFEPRNNNYTKKETTVAW